MQRFIMLIGLPASGKSTYAAELGLPTVSSDSIREELFGDINDQTHNNEVFNEVHRRVLSYIKSGKSCIYDATNLSRKRRKNFLKQLPKSIIKVAKVFATEYELCLEQNSKRDRKVPEEVIERMYKHINFPRIDEGFDSIDIITHPDNKKDIGNYFNDCKDLDQDNPNHTLTLSEHMFAAHRYVIENGFRYSLDLHEQNIATLAALYHDIGKPVVKSRIKWNGELDNCSHYYNHAEVGAYMIACCMKQSDYSFENDLFRDVLPIVQWHMEKFNSPNNYISKFEKYYGIKMARAFELVCEADVHAH